MHEPPPPRAGIGHIKTSLFIAILLAAGRLSVTFHMAGTSTAQVAFSPNDLIILALYGLLAVYLNKKRYVPSPFAHRILLALASGVSLLMIPIIHHLAKGSSPFEFVGYLRNCYASVIAFFVVDFWASARPTPEGLTRVERNVENGLIIFGFVIFITMMAAIIAVLRLPYATIEKPFTFGTDGICLILLIMPLYWQRIYTEKNKIISFLLLFQIVNFFLAILIISSRLAFVLYFITNSVMLAIHFKKTPRWLYRIPLFMLSLVILSTGYFFAVRNIDCKHGMIKAVQTVIPPKMLSSYLFFVKKHIPGLNSIVNSRNSLHYIINSGVKSSQKSDNYRSRAWQEGLRLLREYPWFGAGQRVITFTVRHEHNGEITTTVAHNAPHNFILETGCLLGLWGIAIHMAFILIFTIPLIFSPFMNLRRKTCLFMLLSTFYGWNFFQPTLTGIFTTNELMFFFIGLAHLTIMTGRLKSKTAPADRPWPVS